MFVIEEDGMKKLQVEAHFGKRKALASIRTVCSHVTVSTHRLVRPEIYQSLQMRQRAAEDL